MLLRDSWLENAAARNRLFKKCSPMKIKHTCSLLLMIVCVWIFAGCETNHSSWQRGPSSRRHTNTYVIVHGAWGGGWDWKNVADLLAADGNTVYRPTLTGQGEHVNVDSTNIDLDKHIRDIIDVILWENLHNVVLVGHSYGGMVITGVADRIPDRIRHLVYIDALLPENGEAEKDIRPTSMHHVVVDGFDVPTWVPKDALPPHDVPQSALTFSQPITLTNQAVAGKLPTTYILTVEKGARPEQDDFYRFYERAKARGWATVIMEGDHNVQRSHPRELVRLLEWAPSQCSKDK